MRIRSEEYQNSRERFQKIKGLVNSVIFLVVIILYIVHLFERFTFEKNYIMRNAVNSALNDERISEENQQGFYNELFFSAHVDQTHSQYAFFKLNYILNHATIVMTRFQPVPCAVTSNYISDYNIGCFDPYEIDKSPMTTSDGTTYNYVNNPPDSVSLNVATGSFDNSGYRLPVQIGVDLATSDIYFNRIRDFIDSVRSQFISFNFVVYNPSLSQMACVYRIFSRYNQNIAYFQNFIYVFNTQKYSTGETVTSNFLLALASILIILSILELFHFVPESKEDVDLELYFRHLKKKKGTTTLSKEDEEFILKNKFGTFRAFGNIIKFYPPGFSYLLNLVTVVLILVSGALDLSLDKQIQKSGYLEDAEVNCAPLIHTSHANTIISSILIFLLMLILLKYISLFVPFLARFVRIIQSLISNVYTLGIIILATILILAVYATYTFRPYFTDSSKFQHFYIAIILMILKRNILLDSDTNYDEFEQMGSNMGAYAFVLLILFLYIMLGLLVFKVITAIVIRSMKETHTDMKHEVHMSKAITEKALNIMKEKLYEELKANLKKQKLAQKK